MELEITTTRSFQEAKELIKSPTVLAHYDGAQKLVLICDASPIGAGAVVVVFNLKSLEDLDY